jgi:hypothetical protein
LKITIIWHSELFNGKGPKAKYIIVVGLFHSNAGKGLKTKYIIVVGLFHDSLAKGYDPLYS